ncbi:MAG: molybdenum cofactor guanylyltransferase [Nitrospinae bacterium]|nr:molybdenum cofactor guanylyltransferase [Nitrospinota bacterium]
MTGVILAGGRNSRIGLKKAFLEIGGKRIIDRTAEIYKRIFKEILIISNTPHEYKYLGVKVYTDLIPHRGSLGGIYTGIYYLKSDCVFFAACDMPFLDEKVIRHIISKTDDYDVIVPYFKHRLHPLHAVYSKRCLPAIKNMVVGERLKIKDLFSKSNRLKIKRITDIPETKPSPFFNINTTKDYKQAINLERLYAGLCDG